MGEIVGILLAAGGSERFGGDKLLHPLADGVPVAVAAARHLVQAVPNTIAVVRPGSDRLSTLLSDAGCKLVVNDRFESGMGSSVAAGICAARDAKGWLIALADMPWIDPATITALRKSLQSGASIVAPVFEGKRGNPVGFSAVWGTRLSQLQGPTGARDLIAAASNEVQPIHCQDAGVVRDIDRPADLEG